MFILQVPPPGFGVDDGDALETPEDPAVPEDPPIPEEVAPTISACVVIWYTQALVYYSM